MYQAERTDNRTGLIERIASVADTPGDDADMRVRKHALAVTVAGLIPASLLWVVIGYVIHRPLLAWSSAAFSLTLVVVLSVLTTTKAFSVMVRALLVLGLAYVAVGHVALGGFAAGGASLVWGLVAPVSAVLYFDRRSSGRWFAGYGLMVVAFVVLDGRLHAFIPADWSGAPTWLFAYNVLGPAVIVLLLIRYVDGRRLDAQQQSHRLLHNMLPPSIAERLAGGERLIAESHASVSVLFADVVNFTGLTEAVPARDVLLMLNQLFSIFDRLAERHGLEKIKTMGDSYIAVAGAPLERADHADAAVRMAIEMEREVRRMAGLRRRTLSIRIGIASGPVTAGVIGRQKFAYDIWGDAVNVASRMESFGLPGQIQVAQSTRDLLTGDYPLEERSVLVKGKGQMTTYLLDPAATAVPRWDAQSAVVQPEAEAEPLPEAIATLVAT